MTGQLLAAAAASNQVLFVLSPSGEQQGESPSWYAFTGQTPEAARGQGWQSAIHPEDVDAVRTAWAVEPGTPASDSRQVQFRVHRPNGRFTRVRMCLAPVMDAGRLVEWVACCTEVWADESVRRSEERLRLATEAARVAIWEYDFIAGQMTRTENHDGLYGLEPQLVWQYDCFTQATHPEDRALADAQVQAAIAPGGPDDYAFDFRVIWPDQSVHWLAVSGHVVSRDARGQATLVRGALIDVTRLKQAEAELTEAVRVRDEFLQIASHELNTPLTPLSLKLGYLLRAAATGHLDAAGAVPNLEAAQRQVKRLSELVKDLLDVTRLSTGRLPLNRDRVSLAEVVQACAEQLSENVLPSRPELQLTLDPELIGYWDRARLEQVVENLLVNAIKYGEGKPVQLAVQRAGARARLVVRDHGRGIEPEALPRIFEKFERAPSARHVRGLGLGLYVARQIVHSHGGTLQVESTLGQGSAFTVELPLETTP